MTTLLRSLVIVFGFFLLLHLRAADALDIWTRVDAVPGAELRGIKYANGQFVAIGRSGGTNAIIATSLDGLSWATRLAIPSFFDGEVGLQLFDIAFGNGMFCAVGGIYGVHDLGGAILTSWDGVTWVPHLFWGDSSAVRGITYGIGLFVATAGSRSVVSDNGAEWTHPPDGTNETRTKIAFGGGQFVAIAYDDRGSPGFATSSDGLNWIGHSIGMTGRLLDIVYGSGQFVAVGGDPSRGAILTSSNGADWVERQSGMTNETLQAVAYGSTDFVATGSSGTILTSADGGTLDEARFTHFGLPRCDRLWQRTLCCARGRPRKRSPVRRSDFAVRHPQHTDRGFFLPLVGRSSRTGLHDPGLNGLGILA